MQVSFSVDELTQIVQPSAIRGATSETIHAIASLEEAVPGDLSFLGNPKYKSQVTTSRASLLLLPADYDGAPSLGQLFFLVENPSVALARICARIEHCLWPKPAPGIHPSAIVAPDARIASTATVGPLCVVEAGAIVGDRAVIEAQVFVGRDSIVGEDSWLMPRVVLGSYCQLGKRVRLQPGAVIGSDGFGYEFVGGRHVKVPQVGIVVIGDDVEIGANSTLDRARFSRTVVGEGTKIDNLVQVGHNVIIGKHCILCAYVGISGSSIIEDYVVLAGKAGVGGHITIGRGSKIGGQAGVTGSLPAGSYVIGNPSLPFYLDRRLNVLKQRLPDLFKRVSQIESSLKMLQDSK